MVPTTVVEDVKDIATDGQIKFEWRGRRIAAALRQLGYIQSPAWIDANAVEFEAAKEAGEFNSSQ